MKIFNLLIFIFLGLIALYLIYRLVINNDFTRIDYIFLIIFLLGGLMNSYLSIKKNKKNSKMT
jgi:hypothetical protein